jgi:hypothetical protein
MKCEAEVGLYPLGRKELEPAIKAFIEVLREHGCHSEKWPVGAIPMAEQADHIDRQECTRYGQCMGHASGKE